MPTDTERSEPSPAPTTVDPPARATARHTQHLILATMALAVFVLCLSKGSTGDLISGWPLKGPDDAMRLVQVSALLDGAGWRDLTQYRLNPPDGVPMHWSRLPDLPLAATLFLAEQFLPRQQALIWTAWLVPPVLGVGFFAAFVWAAAPLAGRSGALAAGLVGITLLLPLEQFSAGRVDHHGWQLILALLTAGAVMHIVLSRQALRAAVIGGLAGSLGLWVGAEAIPWLALAAAALALHWIRAGRCGADAMALFGATLTAGCALLLLSLEPSQRAIATCDSFSLTSLGIALIVALFGAAAATAERTGRLRTWQTRIALGAILTVGGLLILSLWFPFCIHGPYAQVPADLKDFWLMKVKEARPLTELVAIDPGTAVAMTALPTLAFFVAAVLTWLDTRNRTLWLVLLLFVLGGFALQYWQIRGIYLANAYAGLALVWPIAWLVGLAPRMSLAPTRILLRLAPPLMLATMPTIAAQLVEAWTTPIAETADPEIEKQHCDHGAVAAAVNGLNSKRAPLLIAAPIDLGASLLLLTPHQVLAAPYHRNIEGLQDIRQLLYTDEQTAHAIVKRRGVELIVICPDDIFAKEAAQEDGPASLSELLLDDRAPRWLRNVPVDGEASIFAVED